MKTLNTFIELASQPELDKLLAKIEKVLAAILLFRHKPAVNILLCRLFKIYFVQGVSTKN